MNKLTAIISILFILGCHDQELLYIHDFSEHFLKEYSSHYNFNPSSDMIEITSEEANELSKRCDEIRLNIGSVMILNLEKGKTNFDFKDYNFEDYNFNENEIENCAILLRINNQEEIGV